MTTVFVDHLWQSTLFVVVAWLLTLTLRNNAARVRYWVWLAASLKFLVPFSLLTMLGNQFNWLGPMPANGDTAFIEIVQQFSEPLATPQIVFREPSEQTLNWALFAISIWAIGSLLLLLRWAVSWWHVASAVRNAEPMQMQAPIIVKSTSLMHEPGVVGVLRPVLLLPHGIATRLSEAQMQAVIAHELCHVRRRDNLTAAIHMLVEALFWFHPLVWWIGARLVEERERACDETVVELGNEPQAYAEGILKVCQFYMESKLACVAGVSGANLKNRVEGIMSKRIITGLNFGKQFLLTTAAGTAICAPFCVGIFTASEAQVRSATQGQLAQSQLGERQIGSGGASTQFDEVTIKLGGGSEPGDDKALLWRQDGNYIAKNLRVTEIIASAYGVHKTTVVGGPEWTRSMKFVVEGKSKAVLNPDGTVAKVAYDRMAQGVLADRFRLRLHRETRDIPVFILRVANQSAMESAILPVPAPAAGVPEWTKRGSSITPDRTGLAFQNAQISLLASYLSDRLGRPVVDRTGLAGIYNFGLNGKDLVRLDKPIEGVPAAIEQQLGLKLESGMAPMEVLVIDDAQQPTLSTMVAAHPAGAERAAPVLNSSISESLAAASKADKANSERINLKFTEIEIRQVVDILARVSGRTIELDPTVRGSVSIHLNDVTLDTALKEIARIRNLSIRIDNGVVRLQPLPTPPQSPSSVPTQAITSESYTTKSSSTDKTVRSRSDLWTGVQVSPDVDPAVAKLNATPMEKSQRMRGALNLYFDGDRFAAENVTLRDLVRAAYGHLPEQISGGPEWFDSIRFDAAIKLGSPMRLPDVVDSLPREIQIARWQTMQLREELRDLLADRFRLSVRGEKKNAAYKLVIGVDGTKLRLAAAGFPTDVRIDDANRRLTATNTSTQELSSVLSKYLSQPVLNRTSLSARYDFDLRWPAGPLASDAARLSKSLSDQLGLELQEMSIDTLVILHAEKLKDVI